VAILVWLRPSSSSPPARRRLLIAEDHALVREGMRAMLAREPDLEIVGEAKDGEEALALCRKLRPDLVRMDVSMPRMDGLEATWQIKEVCPQTSVLIVTAHESREYLAEAIRAGAAGYVLKEAPKGQLVGAVRRVLEGESPMNQELAMHLLRELLDEAPPKEASSAQLPPSVRPSDERVGVSALESFSPRELEVLRLVAIGRTNQQIAKDLLVSVSTVKKHVRQIISKLGVSDRTQAAVMAVELGLHPERDG
jgi:DNA-binding NarL/FixJ family response regulator